MPATQRRHNTPVASLAVGVLVLAGLVGCQGDDPDSEPSADESARTTASPSTDARHGDAEDAALRFVPGFATTSAGDQRTLSSDLAALGLPADTIPAAAESLGPPAWVKPGTRVSWYSAAASVAQSRFGWVEDPNGDWEDPVTGKKYRRTDETGESMGWASGDGFGQVDVLAVEGTDVVLQQTLYVIDRTTGNPAFTPGGTGGAKVGGAEIVGTWFHPARLAQLQEARVDGVLILRGPYPLNGTTYQAISFAITTPGAYAQYTYDTKTGVLLSATTSTQGAGSPVTSPTEAPPQGNTQLTVTRFAGMRQRTIPGAEGTSPSWVGSTRALDYTGTYYFANPVDPSSGSFTSPMSVNASMRPGGDEWASYSAHSVVQSMGWTQDGTGVTGPTGLYWLSPQALAGLASQNPGKVLDSDPVTGEKVVLDSVGTDPGTGRNLVTLSSRLPGITTRAGYDTRSGVLAAYATQVPNSGTTIDLRLRSGP